MTEKTLRPYPRLGFGIRPPEDGDKLPMISPDFEGNLGQCMCLINGPLVVS